MSVLKRSIPVVIVGGGQAGLCASYYLTKSKIEHVVLERSQRFHSWKNDRWDSFCLVTPNWQCRMPDWHYNGDDPNGYMVKDEIVNYLEDFANSFKPPIHEGTTVEKVDRDKDGKFFVKTSESEWIADSVILATGSYDLQTKPEFAQNLNPDVFQISSKSYKRPSDIPDGVCLVVGTGQSGVQMMEDLWIAGREVRLCVGTAPRSPRIYRGRDATDWLFEIGEYSKTIGEQPNPKLTESKTNHYLSGRNGGHEIDLREFALKGLKLYGSVCNMNENLIQFKKDLNKNLDRADESYLRICKMIDDYIDKKNIDAPQKPLFEKKWLPKEEIEFLNIKKENITSILWCTGFKTDYSWLKIDCLDSTGRPIHQRGVSDEQGLYFLGLNWLHTWGSGRFLSVAEDAEFLVQNIKENLSSSKNKTSCFQSA